MSDTNPPPSRGQSRLEERIYRLEERLHQMSNATQLSDYKHSELDKDFQEYRRQTTERMKWGWLAFVGFMGSIVIPVSLFFLSLATKGPNPP